MKRDTIASLRLENERLRKQLPTCRCGNSRSMFDAAWGNGHVVIVPEIDGGASIEMRTKDASVKASIRLSELDTVRDAITQFLAQEE